MRTLQFDRIRRLARAVALLCVSVCMAAAAGAQSVAVQSPDKRIKVTVNAEPFSYSVEWAGANVIDTSALGLQFHDAPNWGALKIASVERSAVNRQWTPVWGKSATIADRYNQAHVFLREAGPTGRSLGLIVRVSGDGVAFRYDLPRQPGAANATLIHEDTEFRFHNDAAVWAGTTTKFHHSYEQEFPQTKLSALKPDSHVVLPVLARASEKLYVAITEAHLEDWAGMYLKPDGQGFKVDLSPRLDGAGLVQLTTPRVSPWRVIMLAERPGAFVESNLIENLNPPSAIRDTSWIVPGMIAWDHWWSGDVKMDNETNRSYIRFASEMGFPYQLIDWQWYGEFNRAEADITRPAPQLDFPGLLQFARNNHVREWLWLHSGDVDRAKRSGTLAQAFALYERWGVAGVKIDFMDSNDQAMVNWYTEVLRLAAAHHLMVDFHGAYVPTGLRVTWPNLLTREGVLGNEYSKFSTRDTPVHKLTLPFIRMIAGPMDYTPGGFLNRSPAAWKQTTPTEVMGSRAQELALFVVYYSPLTCVADAPEHILHQPGAEFLKVVPTVWDDTKVLNGEVGEHIVVARKRGTRWFVGGMTADRPFQYDLSLSFLGKGRYKAHVYSDPTDSAASYEAVDETTRLVSAVDTLHLSMRPAGGAALWFEPVVSGSEAKQAH